MLEKEFNFYLENQAELLKKYAGKFLVIAEERVVGAFDTNLEALQFGEKNFEAGTFLIQRCTPGNTDYTQTFHSRVTFA